MKKFASYILYTLLLSAIVCACSDDLDVHKVYAFDLVTMPVQAKIIQNETAEIRCKLEKEGRYSETRYSIRFFQVDGRGELRLDDGTLLQPNDLYPLDREVFRLYYTSRCSDQQTIDIFIEDSFGQVIQKTFSFQNENVKEESEDETLSFKEYMKLSFSLQQRLLAMDTSLI